MTRGGGGSGACVVCGLSSSVGRGVGTLLVDPGVVLAWSGAVRVPGVRALKGGGGGASRFGRGALKVVAVASVTVGGRRAGRRCLRAWDGWGRMS